MAYIPSIYYVFIAPSPTSAGRYDKGTEFMLRRYAFPMILLTSATLLAGCSPTGSTADTAGNDTATLALGNEDASLTDNGAAINETLADDEGNVDAGGNERDLNAAAPR